MSDELNHPKVFAPCKRGGDKATIGQSCKSREAYKLSGSARHVEFQCTTCGYQWSVDQGGAVDY